MEILHKIIDEMFNFLKSEQRKWKKVIFIIVLLCFIPIMLWGYNRINFIDKTEKRIETLSKLTQLDIEKINSNTYLKEEYDRILIDIHNENSELNYQNYTNILFKEKTTRTEQILKFITGGMWMFALCMFAFSIWKEVIPFIIGVAILVSTGSFLGYVATLIPTFKNPFVNYIGFPILQVVAVIIVYLAFEKSKKVQE